MKRIQKKQMEAPAKAARISEGGYVKQQADSSALPQDTSTCATKSPLPGTFSTAYFI